MRSRLVRGLVVGALPLAFAACSGTALPPYPDVASFCVAKAHAICQATAICAADPTACQANQVAQCDADATAAMASGVRKYNTANAPSCIDALNGAFGNNASQVPFAQLVGPGSITDKCERVFVGSANSNQPCASDYDCAGALICVPSQTGTPSSPLVCASPVAKNAMDYCDEPGAECPTDTYCGTPAGGVAPACIPAAQAGQACSATAPCVSAERCSNSLCVPRATSSGQPCSTNGDCIAPTPYCDVYAGSICTIGLTFATGASDCEGFLLGMTVAGPDAGGAGAGDSSGAD
jgi:Dickkopf-like protein